MRTSQLKTVFFYVSVKFQFQSIDRLSGNLNAESNTNAESIVMQSQMLLHPWVAVKHEEVKTSEADALANCFQIPLYST